MPAHQKAAMADTPASPSVQVHEIDDHVSPAQRRKAFVGAIAGHLIEW